MGFGMNNDTQKKDEKKVSPDKPFRRIFNEFIAKLTDDSVSQFNQAFWNTRGVVIVNELEKSVHRLLIEFCGRNFIRAIPVW